MPIDQHTLAARRTYPNLGAHCPECRTALIRITTGAPWHTIEELTTLVIAHNATEADLAQARERLCRPRPR